jgi:predicted nucleic acid-binding Zn ribbon protein
MRKSNTQNISEVLTDYINQMKIGRKLKEVDIIEAWEAVLGKTINHYTGKIYISDGNLVVHIKSPVVKSELIMMRDEIRKRLNESVGQEIVRSITFR